MGDRDHSRLTGFISSNPWDLSMNNMQERMIAFETDWYNLGGGSSQTINDEFGLSDRDFFAEVSHLVDTEPPASLTRSELSRMRGVIRRRLWMAR